MKKIFAGGKAEAQGTGRRLALAAAGISVLEPGPGNIKSAPIPGGQARQTFPGDAAFNLARAPIKLRRPSATKLPERGPTLLGGEWFRRAATKAWVAGKVESDIGQRPFPSSRSGWLRRALRKALGRESASVQAGGCLHVNAMVMSGWPGGNVVRMKCGDCGRTWDEKL